MNKWKVALAGAVAAALALTGCAGGTSSSGSSSAAPGGTLTLGLITQATTFSAQDANWANESPYMQAVYDTLLHANADGTIVPWLATEWTYDSTLTKLTLKLRTDVKFSDGEAFTADAAAQNLKRFRDGASPNKGLLAQVSDAKAVDASTLEIDLKAADPSLLVSLTQNAGLQESPKAFTASDIKTNPIGSGPYTLDTKNTVPGSSYTFVKNPSYFSLSTVKYDKVVMTVFSDVNSMLNAIKGGQVNAANLLDNSTVDQVKAAGYTINPQELDWTGLILLDRDGKIAPQLKDVRVRQAISYAFDREALLKAIDKGYGTVSEQIFPKSSPAYDAALDTTYTYDVAKAKQLLSDAGYGGGFELSMPSSTLVPSTTWSIIASQLKDVGITVKYTDAGNNFISDMLGAKYPATWMRLQEDPTDWQIANFELTPTAVFNPFKTSDDKVNAWVKTIQTGSDADAKAASKSLNAYVVQQAWYVPWYRVQSSFATDAKTSVKVQVGNAYPYLYNFTPKS
jgi:peptide/nickel transport system substrate-binding protein